MILWLRPELRVERLGLLRRSTKELLGGVVVRRGGEAGSSGSSGRGGVDGEASTHGEGC